MAGQSAKMGPVLRGEISNTQIRPLNGHPPSYYNKSGYSRRLDDRHSAIFNPAGQLLLTSRVNISWMDGVGTVF